jgi:hypothetical protein
VDKAAALAAAASWLQQNAAGKHFNHVDISKDVVDDICTATNLVHMLADERPGDPEWQALAIKLWMVLQSSAVTAPPMPVVQTLNDISSYAAAIQSSLNKLGLLWPSRQSDVPSASHAGTALQLQTAPSARGLQIPGQLKLEEPEVAWLKGKVLEIQNITGTSVVPGRTIDLHRIRVELESADGSTKRCVRFLPEQSHHVIGITAGESKVGHFCNGSIAWMGCQCFVA